ncbi:MAG: formylglycine-generating enzyme family protein [Ferruginibacter sp.]
MSCAAVCKMPSRAVAIHSSAGNIAGSTNNAAEMVLIPAGTFEMGTKEFEGARPLHAVTINSFWMDEHEVTNEQFEKFIKATGYITIAERPLDPKDFLGVPVSKLVPGSAVFTPPAHAVSLDNAMQWWKYVNAANWKQPKGPGSSIKGKENDPVVQVCYEDAASYAKWAGKRLPTEAEWEFAARGNQQHQQYYWGKDLKPGGKWVANIYQGNFPDHNTIEDGYREVAPVKSFPANAFGLYDMDGNVWEWCADLYRPDYYRKSPQNNPHGPADSYDPEEPGLVKHVQRGGSFLCSDQ